MAQVQWFDYLWRVVSARAQFDLARRALASLRENPEALRNFLDREASQRTVQRLAPHEITPATLAEDLEKFAQRLDQNELILTTALFETFMKELHRIIIRLTPTLLRDARPIPLGRLVAQGAERIIEEEIEREVAGLDRKSVRERARYFDERLHLPWGPPELVDRAERTVDLRNRILHEQPDEPVTPQTLKNVILLAILIPGFVCQGVVEHYPAALTEQDRINLGGRPMDRIFATLEFD